MLATDTFAVVDLETTGQSVTNGGKIIQIGITLVRQRRIIRTFDTFVNPGQRLDPAIQQLTHIAQRDVDSAPYFEEVAPVLQQLLADTVIVAHNVNFDYPYLNHALVAAGYPAMTQAAIDTVTLAQILLPMANGYRLVDIVQTLGIDLSHAHRASDDANATAELFLALWSQAEQLPAATIRTLQAGQWHLLRETAQFFDMIVVAAADTVGYQELTPEIVLRQLPRLRCVEPRSQQMQQKPPAVVFDRLPLGTDPLAFLKQKAAEQFSIIIHHHPAALNDDWQASPTGQRLALLATPSDYLPLKSFLASLPVIGSKQEQLLKARLLVWLTQTRTGCLDEIVINRAFYPWLVAQKRADSHFYERAQQLMLRADAVAMTMATYLSTQTDRQLLLGNQSPAQVLLVPDHGDLHTEVVAWQQITLPQNLYVDEVADLCEQLQSEQQRAAWEEIQPFVALLKGLRRKIERQNPPIGSQTTQRVLTALIRLREQLEKHHISGHKRLRQLQQRLAKVATWTYPEQCRLTWVPEQAHYCYQYQSDDVIYAELIAAAGEVHIVTDWLSRPDYRWLRHVPTGVDWQALPVPQQRPQRVPCRHALTSDALLDQLAAFVVNEPVLVVVPANEDAYTLYRQLQQKTRLPVLLEGYGVSFSKLQRQAATMTEGYVVVTLASLLQWIQELTPLPAVVGLLASVTGNDDWLVIIRRLLRGQAKALLLTQPLPSIMKRYTTKLTD